MKRIAYTGPSWAVRSFDEPVERDRHGGTNLAKELGLDVVNLSQFGASNFQCYDIIKNYPEKFDAVLWVYCEPFVDVELEKLATVLSSENFWDFRNTLNNNMLEKINNLGCPVGLIGGHSDITDCNFDNISVIHQSWQKFLANRASVELNHGWGAERAHLAIIRNDNIKPSKTAVELISDTLKSWAQLEMYGVFRWVHPNTKGNQLFAKEIENSVKCFIDTV